MSFPRYPSYKESGVDWLSQVPKTWQLRKIRWLFEIKKRIAGDLGFDVFSITQQGIRIKDLESNDGQISMDYSKYQLVEVGDFAMNHMDLLTGGVDIAANRGVTSPDYRVVTIRDYSTSHDRFFLYLFQMCYRNRIFYGFGQGSSQLGRWRLPTEQFIDFVFPLPSLPEQTAIAEFLDREAKKIDELVAEQRRLMELLKEKRQAVISHAVTRGLSSTTPLKPSGIEWLGDVPSYWEVKRFQRCVYVAEGQVDPEDSDYSSLALIAPNHIESGTGRLLGLESARDQGAESGKYLCKAGDVVYSKIRPSLRKVCIAPEDCLCSADMYPLRAHSGMTNPFLLWSMLSEQFSALAVLESQRVAMPKINRESLKEVMLAVPPVEEQQAIVAFIESETVKFDALTAEAQRAIDLLQERRTALISAAVTGQIDVRALAGKKAA